MGNVIDQIKEYKNWILKKQSNNVKTPKFNIGDLLKEKGIKIHIKDTNEKSPKINFNIFYSYNTCPDTYIDVGKDLCAVFKCNGYTFSKSDCYDVPIKETYVADDLRNSQIKKFVNENVKAFL